MLCLVTVRVVSVLGPCHWDVLDRKDMHLLNDRNTDFKQFSKSRKVCRIDNFSWKTSLIMYLCIYFNHKRVLLFVSMVHY